MSDLLEDPPGSGLWTTWDFSETELGLYSSPAAPTDFVYRGIHIDQSGPFYLQGVEGWADFTAEFTDTPVGGGHGSLLSAGRVGAKTITISGVCASAELQNALFWQLRRAAGAAMTESGVTSELVGDHAGYSLTADVQLARWQATIEQARWSKGVFGFDIEFRQPDPLFYGPWLSGTAVLPQPGAGLALPLSLPQAMPDSIPGGLFSVLNDGSALARAIYTMQGPITNPGVLLNSGTAYQRHVQYSRVLAEGETLVIDTSGGGSGLINGEYRPPNEDSGLAADLVLRPGANTVQALGVAGVSDPLPSISVAFRPAYW